MKLTSLETLIGLFGSIEIVTVVMLARLHCNKQVNSCKDLQNPQIQICGSLQHAGGVSFIFKAFSFTCQTICQSLKQVERLLHGQNQSIVDSGVKSSSRQKHPPLGTSGGSENRPGWMIDLLKLVFPRSYPFHLRIPLRRNVLSFPP